jgi:hypothetical protein
MEYSVVTPGISNPASQSSTENQVLIVAISSFSSIDFRYSPEI